MKVDDWWKVKSLSKCILKWIMRFINSPFLCIFHDVSLLDEVLILGLWMPSSRRSVDANSTILLLLLFFVLSFLKGVS